MSESVFFVMQVSALMQRVQESETLLTTLQQALSEAKRSTQEQMVSGMLPVLIFLADYLDPLFPLML